MWIEKFANTAKEEYEKVNYSKLFVMMPPILERMSSIIKSLDFTDETQYYTQEKLLIYIEEVNDQFTMFIAKLKSIQCFFWYC